MSSGPWHHRRSEAERFWEKVDKHGPTGCWLWTAFTHDGYGRFRWRDGMGRAHRWAWEQAHGPIPEGLQIDHICRVRHCVNPAHLQLVTGRENNLRGIAPSAINARKTHCPYGHPLDGLGRGGRWCKVCRRQMAKAQYARRRGQRVPEVVSATPPPPSF